MMKQISRFISSLFQPLFMPVYSILLLFVYTHFRLIYATKFWSIITPAVMFSFVIPAVLIFAVYKMNLISDLSLKIRSERFIPYLIVLISYTAMIIFYYRVGMPGWFIMLSASSLGVIGVALFITIWWKISAHMFGVSGLIGGVMAVSYFIERTNPYQLFISLFIIAGMVGTSRLILKRHTPAQVLGGFLLGFTVSFVFVWIGA